MIFVLEKTETSEQPPPTSMIFSAYLPTDTSSTYAYFSNQVVLRTELFASATIGGLFSLSFNWPVRVNRCVLIVAYIEGVH